MNTLKVCISGIVACLDKNLETGLHKLADTAAENGLLTEEVCLGLCLKGGPENSGPCSADTKGVCKSYILCFSAVILLNSYKTGNTLSCLILAPYSMSGALGSYHDHVHICGRNDEFISDIESMGKHKHISGFQIGLDAFLIHFSLLLIIDKDHDDISPSCGLISGINLESLIFSLLPGL